MPIAITRTTDADAAAAATDWIDACGVATWRGERMLRIAGTLKGEAFDTYIAHGRATIMETLAHDAPWSIGRDRPVGADVVDRAVAWVEGLEHAEAVRLSVHGPDAGAALSLVAARVGRIEIDLAHDDPAATLARTARRRREDTEARTTTTLGAMAVALSGRDEEDVVRILETAVIGAGVRYRGVDATLRAGDRVVVEYDHEGVAFRSDGIEVPDLPDTVRAVISGRQRRRLGDLVSLPGYEDLDVVNANRAATNNRRTPSRNWIRLDVRDTQGAKLPDVELDEATRIALATFRRRNA